MSRTLPTGLASALQARTIPAAFLVEIDWPDGTVYVWNGYHNLSWNAQTWLGIGHAGQIGEVKESGDLAANGMVLQLSGIPSANIAEVLRNDTQGRPGRVYFGTIDGAGFTIDPVCIFDGVIDITPYSNDGKTATISVNLEKEFIDNRSSAARYTPEDQKRTYPTDLGLDFVPGMAGQTTNWGKNTTAPGGPAGGGGGDGSGDLVPERN